MSKTPVNNETLDPNVEIHPFTGSLVVLLLTQAFETEHPVSRMNIKDSEGSVVIPLKATELAATENARLEFLYKNLPIKVVELLGSGQVESI